MPPAARKTAEEYFEYCEEVGCEVWSVLTSVKEALYEPIGMWLPKHLIKPGTSMYVQGVEVPLDYSNEIPGGYELIELPPCTMMVFQGEPYEDENSPKLSAKSGGISRRSTPSSTATTGTPKPRRAFS